MRSKDPAKHTWAGINCESQRLQKKDTKASFWCCCVVAFAVFFYLSSAAGDTVQKRVIRRGICVLRGTGPRDGVLKGIVRFHQNDTMTGITVDVDILGMGVNETHGIHIHQYGDVSDQLEGLSNGAHFSIGHMSDGARHGRPSDIRPRPHNGDLGNIVADAQGRAKTTLKPLINPWATLDGNEYSVIGRALAVHENKDNGNRSTETGNSGGRLGQCVIGIEGIEDGQENVALGAPISSGSFSSCTLNPLSDSPPLQNQIKGEVRFETTTLGFVNITGLITGLSPKSLYAFVIHRDGNIQGAETLGPTLDPDGPLEPGSSRLPNIRPNCRGFSEYRAFIDGLQFPLSYILGRSLAIHVIDPSDPTRQSLGPVLSTCVVGLAAPTKAVPIIRHNVIPRADCILQGTQQYSTVSGRISINSTDEYDCSITASISVTGVPFTHSSSNTKISVSIHTNGDILDKTSANPRAGPLFILQKLPILDAINGSYSGFIYPPKDQRFNSLFSLSDIHSIVGRSIAINLADGKNSSNLTPMIAQCVVGLADMFSFAPTELSQNLPNSRIGQPHPEVTVAVASMSPTYFFPSVQGHVWFRLQNASSVVHGRSNDLVDSFILEVELALLGNPLTNYSVRIYNHGSIRTRVASNFGESNLLCIIPSQRRDMLGNLVDDYRFLSDKDGLIHAKISPLLDLQGKNILLKDLLGKAILVQPVYDDSVLSAYGFGVIGIADKAYFPAPIPKPKAPFYDSPPNDTLSLSLGMGLTSFFFLSIVIAGIWYRKRLKTDYEKSNKKLYGLINHRELTFGSQIGEGSYGVVYRGEWRGADVAIKIIPKSKISKNSIDSLKSEVSIMVELRHPNIVLYMGACLDESQTSLVCEYMQNGCLHDILHQEHRTIGYAQRLQFMLDISKGMQYLHMCNPPILHRDLKSLNILVDENMRLKVSDFGLTHFQTSATVDGKRGSLLWLAPEVISKNEFGTSADVFSFAIVCWEIIARLEPYEDIDCIASVPTLVVLESLRPALPSNTPGDLSTLITNSWAQRPEERPSFQDISKRLSVILELKGSSSASFLDISDKKEFIPEGNVFIVSSRVFGSEALWDDIPEVMCEATLVHNKIIRQLSQTNAGYISQSDGENFIVVFQHALNAITFCVETQSDLHAHTWPEALLEHEYGKPVLNGTLKGLRAQMGINYGLPTMTVDAITQRLQFSGRAVSIALKLSRNCHGGQVLLTASVFDQLEDVMTEINSMMILTPVANKYEKNMTPSDVYSVTSKFMRDRADQLDSADISWMNSASNLSSYVVPEDCPVAMPPNTPSLHNIAGYKSFGSSKVSELTLKVPSANRKKSSADNDESSRIKSVKDWEICFSDLSFQESQLGSGSFGTVMAGFYKGSEIAIKKMTVQNMKDKYYLSFLSEISVLRKINHPNIIRLIGACTEPPNLAIVMELIKPGSLNGFLRNESNQLTPAIKNKITLGIISGMAYLHSQKPPILHRDLKTANILITESHDIKLCDFGFARIRVHNRTMTKCGTLAYQAPEVIKGERYNEKADVYSFAIVLWEIETRESPYSGRDSIAVQFDVIHGLRPEIRPRMNRTSADLMTRCWDSNPKRRPLFQSLLAAAATREEMADPQLEEILLID